MCLTQKGQIAMDIDRGRLERKYLNLWPGSRKVQNSLQSGKRGFCPHQGKTEQAQSFLPGRRQQVVIYSKCVDTCSLGFILNSSQNISSQLSQWQIFFLCHCMTFTYCLILLQERCREALCPPDSFAVFSLTVIKHAFLQSRRCT